MHGHRSGHGQIHRRLFGLFPYACLAIPEVPGGPHEEVLGLCLLVGLIPDGESDAAAEEDAVLAAGDAEPERIGRIFCLSFFYIL